MREIKFRAWDTENEEMLSFEQVSHHPLFWVFESGKRLIPMQFTGLRDSNGVEIYEGDIVTGWIHNYSKPFVVVFRSEGYSCGYVATDNGAANPYIEIWYQGIKVIGNIHQNPELLKCTEY